MPLKRFAFSVFIMAFALTCGMDDSAFSAEGAYYSIHILTFKTVDEARSRVKEFKDRGYNAYYRQEKSADNADVYNVYIEKFNSRQEADKEAKILKELDLISDYDVREISEKSKTETVRDKQEITEKARMTSMSPEHDTTQKVENKSVIKLVTKKISEAGNAGKQEANGYYLKVSSLKDKANAEEVVKTLKDAGYQAFYNFENVKGIGDWYRVYLEGYQSRVEAEKEAKKLIGSNIISGYEIKRATGIVRSSDTIQKEEKKIYYLLVEPYLDKAHADEEVLRLTELGLKAVSIEKDVSGEQWFRVYIVEFSDEKEAEDKGAELVQKGEISYFKPMLIQ